jgi:hypothetical protein
MGRRRHGFAVPRPIRAVRESVAAPPRQRHAVTETPARAVEAVAARPGRLLIQLIRAGWSLNGNYYPAEVLRRDGPAAWPAGTQCFADHATEEEDEQRPAGSIRNLAATQTQNAYWDEARQALMAEVRLFAPWRQAITDMAETIGMSIRAWVYGEQGEAEGRQGFVVSAIPAGRSVDFVTVPAAGGAIVSVLESVRRGVGEARSIGVWLESRLHLALTQLGDDMYGNGRLTREERIALSSAIGDALQAWTARVEADAPQLFQRDLWDDPEPPEQATAEGRQVGEAPTEQTRMALHAAVQQAYADTKDTWAWVRDFDPERAVVWFEVQSRDGCRLWQQSYAFNAPGQADLTGDPVEVVARTVYDPVASSEAAGQTTIPAPAATAVVEHASGGTPPAGPTITTEDRSSGVTTPNTGPAPGQAGTGTTPAAQPTGQPTSEARTTTETPAETRVVIVEAERDQLRQRNNAMTDQLSEAQAEARRARAEAAEAVAEMRRLRANEAGRTTVDRLLAAPESGVEERFHALIAPRVHATIRDHVPLTDAGEVNQEALNTAVEAAIRAERVYLASGLEAGGAGRVAGLGADGDPHTQMTAEQFEGGMSKIFESIGMPEKTATLAAKGR